MHLLPQPEAEQQGAVLNKYDCGIRGYRRLNLDWSDKEAVKRYKQERLRRISGPPRKRGPRGNAERIEQVFAMRFVDGMTLQSIGIHFGVSRQAIDQILQRSKFLARRRLNYAVKVGKILRPKRCQICKAATFVEAHHEDYSQPLSVIWLCSECHGKTKREI